MGISQSSSRNIVAESRVDRYHRSGNERIIPLDFYCFIKPFLPYIEDQLKEEAKRIESTYETTNFYNFSKKEKLSISLKNVPRELLPENTMFERYLCFDKYMGDKNAEYASYYDDIFEQLQHKCYLPLDFKTTNIKLCSELELFLIRPFINKPHSIGCLPFEPYDSIMTWVRIPNSLSNSNSSDKTSSDSIQSESISVDPMSPDSKSSELSFLRRTSNSCKSTQVDSDKSTPVEQKRHRLIPEASEISEGSEVARYFMKHLVNKYT